MGLKYWLRKLFSRRKRSPFRRHPVHLKLEFLEQRNLPNAAVWTNQPDYHPNTTAIFDGSGFLPNETIELQVVHIDGKPDLDSSHKPFFITDNSAGAFQASWYVSLDNAASDLRLTAIGLTSHDLATTTFTDSAIVIASNTNWSSITTGSGPGGQPTANDTIVINSGITLTVDVSAVAGAVTVNSTGTLAVSNGVAASIGSLTGGGNVTLGNASSALTVGSDNTSPAAFTGAISGTGNLTKIGTGTLTLQGNNTYSGATTINGGGITLSGGGLAASTAFTINDSGTLTLDNTGNTGVSGSATNPNARIANALTLAGGEFVFKGSNSSGVSVAESVGTLTLTSSDSTVTAVSGTGGSTVLTFAAVSRTAGATVLFRGTNLGSNPGAGNTNIKFTTATGLNLTGGTGAAGSTTIKIVPWALGDMSASGAGSSFVTYNIDSNSNSNGIRPLNTSTEYDTAQGSSTSTANEMISSPFSHSGARTYNSILLTNGYSVADSSGLTITSGALAATSGSSTITATVAFGTAAEGVVSGAGNITISAGVSTTGGLTKSGAGTLTLSAVNGYTGTTTVNAGTLTDSLAGALSPGALTVNGSTAILTLGTVSETVGTVTVASGGSITGTTGVLTSTGSFAMQSGTVSAILAGSGINLAKTTSGTVTLSGANTYTGTTTITQGTLSVSSIVVSGSNLGNASSAVILGGASSSGVLSYTGTSAAYTRGFTVNAGGGEIDTTTSGQTLTIQTGGISAGGPLTLGGAGNTTISSVVSSTGGLTKTGAGTLTLSGANTYSGGTAIQNGTVLIGVSNSGTTSGALGPSANAVTLSSGSNNASLLTNGAFTFSNPITVAANNSGTVTIGGNTANASIFSGAITLNDDLTVSQIASGTASITGGISAGSAGAKTVTFAGPGTMSVTTTAITDGSGTVGVTVAGGTTTFSTADTYSGGTTIQGGTVLIGVSNATNVSGAFRPVHSRGYPGQQFRQHKRQPVDQRCLFLHQRRHCRFGQQRHLDPRRQHRQQFVIYRGHFAQ